MTRRFRRVEIPTDDDRTVVLVDSADPRERDRTCRTETLEEIFTRVIANHERLIAAAPAVVENPHSDRVIADAELEDAAALEIDHAMRTGRVGYLCRLLAQVSMPHGPTNAAYYERRSGNVNFSMVAHPRIGLPYGRIPRVVLSWITTEATRRRTHELDLGESLAAWLRSMGLGRGTGGPEGSIRRLREHLQRLTATSISYEYKSSSADIGRRMFPIETSTLWWDPKSPEQATLWRSTLALNRTFYEELIDRPVPVDLDVIRSLRSALALDIYVWLTWRMFTLEKPITVPWSLLAEQFGQDFDRTRDFRAAFQRQTAKVLQHYKTANVEATTRGLKLSPSPTHVPRLRAA